MDFVKVFDQTVREIKREVNLKVLKVPEIEQKVLDATDNEPWGPHGKFSEFQMVKNVHWTRLEETGKDWRYVYKALTVIEYLISHGSERAVDDIIEHTFQVSVSPSQVLNMLSQVGNSSSETRLHGSKDSKKIFSSKLSDSSKYSQSTITPSNNYDHEFDDFDPRGTSSSKPAAESSNQVDLFGPSLIDDLFDAPAAVPMEKSAMNTDSADVLFADATFVSAPNKVVQESSPQAQHQVDLFASHPAITTAASPTIDLFAASDPVVQPDIKRHSTSQ